MKFRMIYLAEWLLQISAVAKSALSLCHVRRSAALPVRLSIYLVSARSPPLSPHWTDFHEIWY